MQQRQTIITGISLTALAVGVYLLIKNKNNMNTGNSQKLPRGYRNNNPLNIRYNPANAWKGIQLPNTDGTFEQFTSMAFGYRAAMYLIRKYISMGYKTVSDIISRWAPNNENNTAGYISRVCATTGYTPATIIKADDAEQICSLVYAMAIVENGNNPLPNINEINAGWNLL